MSDAELKAELERLRKEKRRSEKGRVITYPPEGQRERGSLGLRPGTLSRDPV